MEQANTRCELPKVKSSDMRFFHAFPEAVKAVKQAALQLGRSFHWPLLSSVTAVDSPIMTVCQDVSPLHKTPSCQRWLEHTYLLKATLNTALTRRYRGLWEYEFPVTRGKQRLDGWSAAASSTNMGSKIDWQNHSNMRGWPWSAASPSKPESILLPAFLHPPFAPLLLGFSEGAPSPGPHHSLPMVPKEAEPSTKAAVIAILHSPPPSWKPHFNLKHPPPPSPPRLILPHPPWTGTGQSGPPWDTSSGRSQGSTSQDVEHG